MTNEHRRDRIKELIELLSPHHHEKIVTSLRYNFLKSQNRPSSNEEEILQLEEKLRELNNTIQPLSGELRNLQIKYDVEYYGEVLENGILTTVPNKKVFYLSTDVDIDSSRAMPDYGDEDISNLITEIRDYIYYQEYSQFTIQHVKRL
jgi:predicted RNase H-like nuclease (RuvC/YqgF family)